MGSQPELQILLEDILGSDQVYYQSPPNVYRSYPAILYKRSPNRVKHANNKPYLVLTRYEVTVMTQQPDEADIPDKVQALPSCVMERYYTRQNLHHYVFVLHF